MYKNCYDREAFLIVEEARRQAEHERLIRQLTAGKPPVFAPLLAALGRLLTRTGERLEAGAQKQGDVLKQHDVLKHDAYLTS